MPCEFPAAPHSSAIRLPSLRDSGSSADPPAVIDGCMAAVGVLAWIAACKYLGYSPLYRIEQIGACQGVPLARSTLADWIGRIGVALQPLADRLTGWPNCCARTIVSMPMKHWCASSTLAAARRGMPTSGPIVPAFMTTVYRYSCSTTSPAAPALTRAFLGGWRSHLMVTTTPATNPCLLAVPPSWPAWPTSVASSSMCTLLVAAPSPSRPCNASPSCKRSGSKVRDSTCRNACCCANIWRCRSWPNYAPGFL